MNGEAARWLCARLKMDMKDLLSCPWVLPSSLPLCAVRVCRGTCARTLHATQGESSPVMGRTRTGREVYAEVQGL